MLKIEPDAPDGDAQWLAALRERGFRPNPYSNHIRHEWVMDIRGTEQELLSKMHKKTRQHVRNSPRTGTVVRPGNLQEDIDAFYDIYVQTGQRSEFMILSKEYYIRMLELYGDHAAFLIAEYEGKPIAAAIMVYLGKWCWGMHEAASDLSRKLRINYMLQWERVLWARERGCWYYNLRAIPDVLEEGQELYGIYEFKRSFGGFAMRSLQTHDLVYRPIAYRIYRVLLNTKRWYDKRQYAKKHAQKNTVHDTKDATQSESSQPKEKAVGKIEVP